MMSKLPWSPCRWLAVPLLVACAAVCAQDQPRQGLPQVTITGRAFDPVEKSYRRMVHGMDHFEQARGALAPDASLRYTRLPRKRGTDMDHVVLDVVGDTFSYRVPIAPDRTFVLERDRKALQEDAAVSPNRRKLSMTWRTEIRSPGVPPGMRRLGDLRLECEVGMEAGLISNSNPIGRIAELFTSTRDYCGAKDSRYLFFADRALFGVTLVDGARREILPVDQLYAMASDDPDLKGDLPYCDCEMLVDRTYFLPLGDRTWSNDTLVQYEYMDDRP
jgi:hypothetical protein